ncbi:thymopoietin isoform X2 [Hyperolius riggenbachi]|uniref:thymopoietin isoform X2 n=1 Tax=Hyperolius riggenbachi TaxID=752182 RepID=UPI0035A314CF
MPEFVDNPSQLTKEQLKSELLANNVQLPSGEQRKDVYVQLYKQHLSGRSRATPDFSSDEERESTPMRGRGRPPGRKATKKTDKPTVEEKTEQDVTDLSNEALKVELLKYGITSGPIQGSTRKVYEKKLLKVKEQQITSITSVADTSNEDNNKQNGNTDESQYSDNEEPKADLTFETREPIRGRPKAQVASRSRRLEHNEVVAADPDPDDDADVSKTTPVTETILPSSNQAPVDYQVTETFKHTNALRSVSEFSELSRRTPKKQPMSENIVEKSFTEEKRENRDVLKEMFPYDIKTPTGISATCRRPIKGAAGRPLHLQDYKIEESYATKYVSKYQPVLQEKATKQKTGRSIPMWIKILSVVALAGFAFLVYLAFETNEGIQLDILLQGNSNLRKGEN